MSRVINVFLVAYFFCFNIDAQTRVETDITRELPERIATHVYYLAAHSALTETKKLTLPSLFTDSLVRDLTDRVYRDGTICLRDFWKTEQEQVLSHETTCREFVFLLIALYHNLACSKTASLRGIPWLSLAALYMRLQAIPLNKLFDILDECLSYYQSIINDYGTPHQPPASLTDWILDYWWLPTLMAGMAIATFVRWKRAHQTKKFLILKNSI